MRNTSAAAPLIYRRIRERNAYRFLGNRPLILLLAVYDQSHVAGHLQTIGPQVNRTVEPSIRHSNFTRGSATNWS